MIGRSHRFAKGSFHRVEFFPLIQLPVMFIQWVTTGDHAVARSTGAIAKGATNPFVLEFASCQDIDWQVGIREHHAAQTHRIDSAISYYGLPNIWQPLLQIAVA